MTLAPQITFRNMDVAPELEAAVLKEAGGLEHYFSRIISCRVTIQGPRRHEYGGLFNIRIDLGVPGEELVVEHDPSLHGNLQHLDAERKTRESEPRRERRDARRAIREAFRQMRRRLQDYSRRMRGQIKKREAPLTGTITRLSPGEDFGFLETEGREVYFHRNSVLGNHFNRLRIGSLIRFVEEQGEKGPQASSLRLVRPARQGHRAEAITLIPDRAT